MEVYPVFLGEYQTRFSGKGRIILPKKLRDEIKGQEIILSKGFEGCVFGFSLKDWQKEARVQLEVSAVEEKARFLRRYLFSSSVTVELDNQGRFVIPNSLLEYAGIREEVIVIGAGDHFEIWDFKIWIRHIRRVEREYGRVS